MFLKNLKLICGKKYNICQGKIMTLFLNQWSYCNYTNVRVSWLQLMNILLKAPELAIKFDVNNQVVYKCWGIITNLFLWLFFNLLSLIFKPPHLQTALKPNGNLYKEIKKDGKLISLGRVKPNLTTSFLNYMPFKS